MVAKKALDKFSKSSQDRIDFGAVPSWDERSGLFKCPLLTPHQCPALERAMTLDVSAKTGGWFFKGVHSRVLLPCLSTTEAEFYPWSRMTLLAHFFKLILHIFKDSSLSDFFIVQYQQGAHLHNLTNHITALLGQSWSLRCPFNITSTKTASFPIKSNSTLFTGSYLTHVPSVILLKHYLCHCLQKTHCDQIPTTPSQTITKILGE